MHNMRHITLVPAVSKPAQRHAEMFRNTANSLRWCLLSVLLLATALFSLLPAIGHSTTTASENVNAVPIVDPQNPATSYGHQFTYGIYRKSKKIGTHKVHFSKHEGKLLVAVETDLTVRVLKIPVYSFKYTAHEIWSDGQLQQVNATIKEKNEVHEVKAVRDGAELVMTDRSGNKTRASADFATNHWHFGVINSSIVFNTLTGKPNNVTIEQLGEDTIDVAGQQINARQFRYTGELDTRIWFDEYNRWVKLAFSGSDGSNIEYIADGFTP